MTYQPAATDVEVIDLLREQTAMTVAELADALDVTPTAVRQRLTRLLAHEFLQREATRHGRGRPTHRYSLTAKGRREQGANFADLATALWQELRLVEDPQLRRGLIDRVSHRMAEMYSDRIDGKTPEEKIESVARLFADRRIALRVERNGDATVLNVLSCPYPDLAGDDHSICTMERQLLSELLGEPLALDQCEQDGRKCCTFHSH